MTRCPSREPATSRKSMPSIMKMPFKVVPEPYLQKTLLLKRIRYRWPSRNGRKASETLLRALNEKYEEANSANVRTYSLGIAQ